jgi:Na+/proline symporter
MALIGVLLIVFTVTFFIIFSVQQDRQGEVLQMIGGFIEVLIVNFLLIVLLILLASFFSSFSGLTTIPLYGLGGLGVLQVLYVVPRSLYLRRRQRWAKLKGVIAAAVIVALLNGGCWVFMAGLGGM